MKAVSKTPHRLDASPLHTILSLNLLCVAGLAAQSQIEPATPLKSKADLAVTAQQAATAPPTLDVRTRVMLKNFVGYQALYATVPGLAIDQVLNVPKEWGRGGDGFARRAGSRYGRYVIGETIEFAVSGLLDEDPRYIYSKRIGVWNRTKDAIAGTFLVPKVNSTSRTLAIGRISGVFGSRAIASRWEPDSQRSAGTILQHGATGMATKTAISIGREFWPDIRRKVFHKP